MLGGRQEIAALCGAVVLIFTCGAADDDNGDIGLCSSLLGELFCDGHFLLAPRLLCPAHALFKRMVLQPVAVGLLQLLVDGNVFVFF